MKEENVYEVGDLVVINMSPSRAKIIRVVQGIIDIHSIGIVTGTVFGIPECRFGSQTIPLIPIHIKHLEET